MTKPQFHLSEYGNGSFFCDETKIFVMPYEDGYAVSVWDQWVLQQGSEEFAVYQSPWLAALVAWAMYYHDLSQPRKSTKPVVTSKGLSLVGSNSAAD